MITLSNGREIEYDWSAISQKEWRVLIDKETDPDTNDIIVGKLVGMSADELGDQNPIDYRKIAIGIWESFKKEADLNDSKN